MGYPGYKRYFLLLETNYFRNCPLTVEDAKRALHIHGPDIDSLKGKKVRAKPETINEIIRVDVPDTIKDLHPHINLSVDYFFVQGIAFLHSISEGYNFRTVEYIRNFGKKYNKAKMLEGVKRCINLYHSRDLSVMQLNADNEFGCIKEEIRPIKLNMVAAGEHVGNIERSNRTVKEGTRCHIHRCPYERYPRVMVAGCVVKAVKDLNQLPSQSGISQELSPSTLITGDACPDFKRINALNFGDYVHYIAILPR